MLSMQMHRLIFNTCNKGMIQEFCTRNAYYDGYSDSLEGWSETMESRFCLQQKLGACDGRDEETPALFFPPVWQYLPLLDSSVSDVFVHMCWTLKQARREQQSTARNREGRLGPWWPQIMLILVSVWPVSWKLIFSVVREALSEALQSSYAISGSLNHLLEVHFSLRQW